MALPHCAWCVAPDTQAAFDLIQCLACAKHSTFDGQRAVPASQANEGVTVTDLED